VNNECEQFREHLSEYLYGEPVETGDLDRHLEKCPGCRRELEAARRSLAAVDRAGLDAAPEQVVERVISGVTAQLHGNSRRAVSRRWLRAVASIAACLLVGALGAWYFISSAGKGSSTSSNGELQIETRAVAAEAKSVLTLLDELERENDTLLQVLGGGPADRPGAAPDGKKESKGQV
jgi:anti-sigma factor RsiW